MSEMGDRLIALHQALGDTEDDKKAKGWLLEAIKEVDKVPKYEYLVKKLLSILGPNCHVCKNVNKMGACSLSIRLKDSCIDGMFRNLIEKEGIVDIKDVEERK